MIRRFECPFCGFVKNFFGNEAKKYRKRFPGFTCPGCGKKVTDDDVNRIKGRGPKSKDKRRKRVRKEVVNDIPLFIFHPYIEEIVWRTRGPPPQGNIRDLKRLGRSGWQSKPHQPIDRSFEEAVISSLNLRPSAPIPHQNSRSGQRLEKGNKVRRDLFERENR